MLYRGPPVLTYFVVNAAHSPDGIHWTPYPVGINPVIPLRSDAANNFFWDPTIERYVAYVRFWQPLGKDKLNSFGPGGKSGPNLRIVGRTVSKDFINWSPPEIVIKADEKDDPDSRNFYAMAVMRYEGAYFGFIPVLHPDNKVDMQLVFSRDGLRWKRAGDRKVFLSNGVKDSFDASQIYMFQAPLVRDDQIWIYYVGATNPHGSDLKGLGGIGLAKLRYDGFISVEPIEQQGVLTTEPFVFKGDQLEINANAAGGTVEVEVLEYKNMYHSVRISPIAGFTRDDCVPIKTDSIRHIVKWKNGCDLSSLKGKTIKLKFYMKNAKLYSFKFIER